MITLLLGFASGLPLALSSSTLQAWYTVSNLSLKDIGLVGLAAAPYTFKFIWAPLMDRFVPPFLGRRRGWIFLTQLLLSFSMIAMALFNPSTYPEALFLIACFMAFMSASQDIAIDAYTVDFLSEKERAVGAAMKVNGYRTAMLISGGVALVIAHHWGFPATYMTMGVLMAFGMLVTLMGPEPIQMVAPPKRVWDCTVLPFIDFLKRPKSIFILLFIVFYKFGDAFAGALSQTFLIREIQFSLAEIGTMVKFLGFLGTILGTLIGALFVNRIGWFSALLWFGVLQAVSNLAYMVLLWVGADYFVAGAAILIENLCGGMGTAAFVGLLMGLCNARFTAFQFALLSSLSAVGRVFVGPLAGIIAQDYGWSTYFLSSVVFSIPGLLLLIWLKSGIENMTETQSKARAEIQLKPISSQA